MVGFAWLVSSLLIVSDCLRVGTGLLVEESGKIRNGAAVIPGGVALELHEGLLVAHVLPQVGVKGEHGLVLIRLCALQCKAVREVCSSEVKALLVKEGEGRLITGVIFSKNNCKSLLLHHLNLPALLLGQATIKNYRKIGIMR